MCRAELTESLTGVGTFHDAGTTHVRIITSSTTAGTGTIAGNDARMRVARVATTSARSCRCCATLPATTLSSIRQIHLLCIPRRHRPIPTELLHETRVLIVHFPGSLICGPMEALGTVGGRVQVGPTDVAADVSWLPRLVALRTLDLTVTWAAAQAADDLVAEGAVDHSQLTQLAG